MITDALARDRRICMVRLRPGFEASYGGKPEVYPVGGVGEIVSCERLATGRYDLVLRGQSRVRLTQERPSDTLYRLVVVEPIEDVAPATDVKPILDHIRTACRSLLTILGRPADFLDSVFAEGQPPGTIADRIASGVLPGADVRQELLETAEIDLRLGRLAVALDALVDELRRNRS
jgi:Lon protease-like protein